MLLKDITFPTPEENILYDDVLLQLAEHGKGEETLRFWESEQLFIVLGRISVLQDDVKLSTVVNDGLSVLRRSSGGGTVVQGKGCLNYTLILSKAKHPSIQNIKNSYCYILEKLTKALNTLGLETKYFPVSDVVLTNLMKKISGNAQKRAKKFILHHGTILYDFNLKQIEKYLKMPKDIPEYRKDRNHIDFVANIHCKQNDIKESLKRVFKVKNQESRINDEEKNYLLDYLKTKNVILNLAQSCDTIN